GREVGRSGGHAGHGACGGLVGVAVTATGGDLAADREPQDPGGGGVDGLAAGDLAVLVDRDGAAFKVRGGPVLGFALLAAEDPHAGQVVLEGELVVVAADGEDV